MLDKGWKGADLIFDLDGDHLPGVSDRDFPSMLELIQEQAWTLWSDFLSPEFGFDENYLQLSYSGHRGYHIHIPNSVFNFSANEELPFQVKETLTKLIPGIDPMIYMRTGLYRVPHTVNNKTGLYKVPLTYSELMNSKVEEIHQYAKTPRLEFP